MARPKDQATDQGTHRVARRLALGAVILLVVAYALLAGFRHETPDRSADAYCRQIDAVASFDQALGDLDAGRAQDALTQLDALDRVAPADIEPQLRVVLEASRPLVDGLQHAAADPEGAVRQVIQAHQADMARVDAAAKAVAAYTSSTCHRELETTVPSTTATTFVATSTTAFAPAKPSTSSSVKPVPPPVSTPTGR